MISYNKQTKGMVFSEHITSVEGYFITWTQMVSSEGKIYGIGSFQQNERAGYGGWSKTLQKRINARHEKKEDWKEY